MIEISDNYHNLNVLYNKIESPLSNPKTEIMYEYERKVKIEYLRSFLLGMRRIPFGQSNLSLATNEKNKVNLKSTTLLISNAMKQYYGMFFFSYKGRKFCALIQKKLSMSTESKI